MGVQEVGQTAQGGEQHRAYMQRLLADLAALDRMLREGFFESGVRRIGAEQEVVLVDQAWQPAPRAVEILDDLQHPLVTTEIARFNLEFNLEPMMLEPGVLTRLENRLNELLEIVREAAARHDADALLVGILPTLGLAHLGLDNITPRPRYHALNDTITRMRRGHYELRMKGTDELVVEHDSIMLEALNTSFQLHFQTSPDEFAHAYNLAQAIAAPVLAASVNSPVLFGKRLWRETRIAIFQQTVDTRAAAPHERDLLARVRFGEAWVNESVVEIFRNDIARFRVLIPGTGDENPMEALDAGRFPKLAALQTHNSTVYRWNRPCYGITDGRPHLRIECRYLPSGPTIIDEVANAALWFGLMLSDGWGDMRRKMDFDDARSNFVSAAREGLGSQLVWTDGHSVPAQELLRDELIPAAAEGLTAAGVDRADIDRCLDVVRARIETRQTGSQWMLASIAGMKGQGTRSERLGCLTATIARNQQGDCRPVHTWEPADLKTCPVWQDHYLRVEQYMNTDLYTVHEEELIDLAASIMDWERIRHIPVEDESHHLVGLVSYRRLLRLTGTKRPDDQDKPIAVSDIMEREVITVEPETSTVEAIGLMKKHRISCLPVVKNGRLVGMVSEHEFAQIASTLLEQSLKERLGADA